MLMNLAAVTVKIIVMTISSLTQTATPQFQRHFNATANVLKAKAPSVFKRQWGGFFWSIACMAWVCSLFLASPVASAKEAPDAAWAALQQGGHIVLFRHANAPGGGDPGKVVIGDCTTQRNLDVQGRAQSASLGNDFRSRKIAIDGVWTSQWCRTRDTAALAFPEAAVKDQPAFNSFFSNTAAGPEQIRQAKRLLLEWSGKGNLVVFSHYVNIGQLTDVYLASGEGVVLKRVGQTLQVLGRVMPKQ
jgi:phosphohistidine phosphatase SixA